MGASKKEKKPTRTQQQLIAAVRRCGVERRCYKAHRPGGVTLAWHWVTCDAHEQTFQRRTVQACLKAGWLEEIRGGLKPGCPPHIANDPLRVAMGDWRLPDKLIIPEKT